MNKAEILDALKLELEFMEAGLYRRAGLAPWGQPEIFRDSLICINYGDDWKNRACRECALGQFVPPAELYRAVPCHQIPLTEAGETIEYLEAEFGHAVAAERVEAWLRRTIKELEADLSAAPADDEPHAPA